MAPDFNVPTVCTRLKAAGITIVRIGSFASVAACLFTSDHEAIPDI
jgi:hypothetical protein